MSWIVTAGARFNTVETERVIRFASCPVLVVPRQAVHRDTMLTEVEAGGELVTTRER